MVHSYVPKDPLEERDLPEIVLVGRSNVGKSSLIRAITRGAVDARVGKRPGVTRKPVFHELDGELVLVDMPGFGFMSGIPRGYQERVKDLIVRYLEEKDNILFAIHVVDAKALPEIAERWERRGEIPIDREMLQFLNEVGLDPVVAANKIDKIKPIEFEEHMDAVAEALGLFPPWRQWLDTLFPISAKTGEGLVEFLEALQEKVRRAGYPEFARFFRTK
ncbi:MULTISPECIES: GTP-binding protein EngB [unclassified Methanopyrus]|uniref:GTP-binding protein EngB n=1 Tax=Methanopyrus sp. SNP6 TaxID=1937005 RepID=UPI001F1E87FB|nr:GTP-binding protein EngB [Methanopyrus sp. SNP6]